MDPGDSRWLCCAVSAPQAPLPTEKPFTQAAGALTCRLSMPFLSEVADRRYVRYLRSG